jgi:hypothetical protein
MNRGPPPSPDGLGGGLGVVGEDTGEVGAIGVDEDDFEQCGKEAHADAMSAHEKHVEDQNVDEDGAEDDEAEWCSATNEDQQASEDLEEADVMHPAAGDHDRHELRSRRAGRGWWRGKEGMKDVGTHDDEQEPKQDATNEGDDFHG